MDAWLGIDASTQSLSALLVDSAGEVLGEASVRFGDDLPGYDAPDGFRENPATGEVFADPRMWLDGLDLCLERLKAAGADFPRVAGVSGAGQQHGTVYLGGRWIEAVAVSPDADRLAEAIGPALFPRFGWTSRPAESAPKSPGRSAVRSRSAAGAVPCPSSDSADPRSAVSTKPPRKPTGRPRASIW